MRRFLVALLLVATARAVVADDKAPAPPPTPDEAADQALAAATAKNAAKLKELASMDRPDPWLVADLLCARGEFDVAAAFAKASPRPDLDKLPSYLASRRGKPDDADARKALANANDALRAGKPADALAALDAAEPKGGDLVAILLRHARGQALRGLERFKESVAVFRETADAAEALGWLARAALAAHESGTSGRMDSDLPTALAGYERRLAIEERRKRLAGIGDSLSNVGAVRVQMADYRRALECLEKARKILDDLGYRDRVALIDLNIGAAHECLGDHAVAIEIVERAMKTAEELGDRKSVAIALSTLASAHRELGEFDKAIEIGERVAKLNEELGDRAAVAGSFVDLGDAHMVRGDYAVAMDSYRRALAIAEEIRDRPVIANAVGGIGAVHLHLAEYAQAIDTLERACKLKDEVGDRRGVAKALTNLGVAYESVGDPTRALELHQESLKICEEMGDRATATVNLSDIGIVYADLGDYAKALEFHERALRLSEELHDAPGIVRSLADIGLIEKRQGDYAKALATSERAFKAAEDIGDRGAAAHALGHIGAARMEMHEYTKAVELMRQALARADEIGDQSLVVGTHSNLAAALAGAGDLRGGLASARTAVQLMQTLTKGAADEQSASTRAQFEGVFMIGAGIAAHLGDAGEAAFFIESGRAGTLLESMRGREALRAAAIPEALRNDEAAARAAETAAVAALRKALDSRNVADVAARRKELDAARDRLRDVVARIQRDAKAAAGLLYPECDTLDVIRGRLKEGEALVLYVRYGDEKMNALVVTRDGGRIVSLGAANDIEAACAALTPDDPASDTGPAVATLTKLVVDPLGLDAKVKRVLISPDGVLSYVPFALLCGDRDVAYVPSGTTYGLLLAEKDKKGEGVLALGDPDYGSAKAGTPGAVAMRGGMNLVRLPSTAVEAKTVGDVVLVGKDASEQGLRDAVKKKPRWHAVHLACHGLVDADRPMLSSLAVTPSGDDDGYLTALEIFRLKLPADLVVLSACETGKGKVVKAEGIVGLTRAFMFAGAPRVIVSLWKVDDQATAALMAKFYEGFKKGVPAARALRDAQAHVRSQEKWKHPFYWAAWSLWGLPD